jgi:hypothetical protein
MVLRPDSVSRADPGLEPYRVEEKTGEEKTRSYPADPAGWPSDSWLGQKHSCNLLKIDPDDPLTWSKLKSQALNWIGSKNYGFITNVKIL